MPIFLTVATDRWRCNALIGSVEHPIGAECNVRTMESHGTSYIEITLVNHFTELGHECHHAFHLLGMIVDRVMEIFHAVLITEERKLV